MIQGERVLTVQGIDHSAWKLEPPANKNAAGRGHFIQAKRPNAMTI